MPKRANGHRRNRNVNVRFSESDHAVLVKRAARAGAKTPSAYIRAATLTGQEFELPSWDLLRALICAMTECTEELRKAGASPAVEAKAIEAFERIVRL
jgi:hypothetical protein